MMITEWEENIRPEHLWHKVREEHPAILNPVTQKDKKDRRREWLTYKNINDWTDREKKCLVDMGMVKDEPGWISEFCYYYVHIFSGNF